MTKPKIATAKGEFVCEFCRRAFISEDKVLLHICEQKRRHMQRDEKPVRLGFIAYQQFYARRMGQKTPPSYPNFAKNKLYGAFVRFGRQVIDLNAVNPLGFIDFLIHLEVPIDEWINPIRYETYIRELNKQETPWDAWERNFLLMKQWAADNDIPWQDFFRKIEVPLAALWIASGRISPWILFVAPSAHELMQRFGAAQNDLVERSIDLNFWQLKIKLHQTEVERIREVLAEKGI